MQTNDTQNPTPPTASRRRLFLTVAGVTCFLALAAFSWHPLMLMLLAVPVAAWARTPKQDLGWAFGLAVGGSLLLAVGPGPGAFLRALIAQPLQVGQDLAYGSWVIAAFALGFLAGVRVFQKVHAYSMDYRRTHAMDSDDHSHA